MLDCGGRSRKNITNLELKVHFHFDFRYKSKKEEKDGQVKYSVSTSGYFSHSTFRPFAVT